MEEPDFADWVGRCRSDEDEATTAPVRALAATLDLATPATALGEPIPPAWHWLYFLATASRPNWGATAPRRAANSCHRSNCRAACGPAAASSSISRCASASASAASRRSRLSRARPASRASWSFVTVGHEIAGETGAAVSEEHIIVYRSAAVPGATAAAQQAPEDRVWLRRVTPDPILLFRFSALTFNGHRIHYDRAYCTEAEGYPGLVVHGPLQAMLLLELARAAEPARPVRRFDYRALAPIFDTGPFTVNGRPEGDGAELWTADGQGHLGMSGRASF